MDRPDVGKHHPLQSPGPGHDRFDVGGRTDLDAGGGMQEPHCLGEEPARLDYMMLAGGGEVGRPGESQDGAPAQLVDQDRRADHAMRAEEPVGVAALRVGQHATVRLHQLAAFLDATAKHCHLGLGEDGRVGQAHDRGLLQPFGSQQAAPVWLSRRTGHGRDHDPGSIGLSILVPALGC